MVFNPNYIKDPVANSADLLNASPGLDGTTFEGSFMRTMAHEMGHYLKGTPDIPKPGTGSREQREAITVADFGTDLAEQRAPTVAIENAVMAELVGKPGAPTDAGLTRGVYAFRPDLDGNQNLTNGDAIDRAISGETGSREEDVTYDFTDDSLRDLILAGGGDDTVKAGGGNDYIYGGSGNDTLDGGSGRDVASYALSSNGIVITADNIQGLSILSDGEGGEDTLANIEVIKGSDHSDIFFVKSANLSNFDEINGIIDGGKGHDILDLSSFAAGASVVVDLSVWNWDWTNSYYSQTITISGEGDANGTLNVEDFNQVRLGIGNDTVYGSWGTNWDNYHTRDPLVLDLNGDGFSLVGFETSNISFDMDGDGDQEFTGWVTGGDAFLVQDTNGDGIINDVSEMFGDASTDGFAELGAYDSNNDGVVDANDDNFAQLQVWQDLNGDGETDQGELQTLTEAEIASINIAGVAATQDFVEDGNAIIAESTFTRTNGEEGRIGDVLLGAADEVSANSFSSVDLGGGDDKAFGGNGVDWIYGGDGNDIIYGGAGSTDVLLGDAGNDTLYGQDGFDYLYGYADNDLIYGGNGIDVAYGGDGVDTIYGEADTDWLFGGNGNDFLNGGANSDLLIGESGADIIDAGTGNDWIWGDAITAEGGGGADHFVFVDGDGVDVIYDFEDGIDLIDLSGSSANSIADLSIGQIAGGFTWIAHGTDVIYLWGAGDHMVGDANITAADFIF